MYVARPGHPEANFLVRKYNKYRPILGVMWFLIALHLGPTAILAMMTVDANTAEKPYYTIGAVVASSCLALLIGLSILAEDIWRTERQLRPYIDREEALLVDKAVFKQWRRRNESGPVREAILYKMQLQQNQQ